MLYLYNSLMRTKEKFIPNDNKKVKMYVCGITPYDTTHLGHAFTYVSFDVLVRYLQYKGYEVIYTQNVTDIDDDILLKAKQEDRDWRELGDFWTKKFLDDMKSLNVLPPTHFVKATNSIALMIRIIRMLIDKGIAYEKDGNVYFETKKFKNYGNLSKFNDRQMKILLKERGGNPDDPLKKDPLDFLLWQKTKPDEPFWESPWEKGRPGWHIECSSMIKNYLGDQIDIHGGGRDLIFPHHESEIAQSESFTNKKPFAKFWVHTAMVLYQGEKMAKSLGNLVMVSNLLKYNNANEIKWLLLSHHYRKPWEFEKEELELIKKKLLMIKKVIKTNKNQKINTLYVRKFITIMDNDLNTPQALNFILDIVKKPNLSPTILKCLSILGIEL
ncbi:MAG: cysteine--tRNA ligase [Patescibacteria group bacterium]